MIHLGIVGCGRFAQRRILPAIKALQKCKVYGIQNRSLEKAGTIASAHAIPFFTSSYEELIFHPRIEAVLICSPNYLHKEQLLLCAKRGIPVFCEKPLAICYEEYLEVMEAFSHFELLSVGQCYRFKPSIVECHTWAKKKRIGEVQSLDLRMQIPIDKTNWRYQKKYGGGALLDLGIHLIDSAHFILEDPIEKAEAFAKQEEDIDGERLETRISMLCQTKNKIPVTMSAAFDCPYETGFALRGSKGKLVGEFVFRQADDSKERLTYTSIDEEATEIPLVKTNIYHEELKHFLASMCNEEFSPLSAALMEENYIALDLVQKSINSDFSYV